MLDEVFLRASEYVGILMVPIFCLTVIFLADEIVLLLKRTIVQKRRRRYE